jgi:hypothetical protein
MSQVLKLRGLEDMRDEVESNSSASPRLVINTTPALPSGGASPMGITVPLSSANILSVLQRQNSGGGRQVWRFHFMLLCVNFVV